MRPSSTALRAASALAAAALAVLLAEHVLAVRAALGRTLDADEVQYLHAGWLLSRGLRLYRDFCEDHAPFLFVILKWLLPPKTTPAFPRLDVLAYVARGRVFSALCGAGALAAIGALTYRATRSLLAPLFTVATLLGGTWVWRRALADLRNDPPSLFLFWLGALLLFGQWRQERWRFALAGAGIGLATAAALWNPKSVFECAVVGAFYLVTVAQAVRRGFGMFALTVAPALAIAGGAIACIAATGSLRDYVFFTFQYNRIVMQWFVHSAFLAKNSFGRGYPFLFCDEAFKGILPVIAVAIAAVIAVARRRPIYGAFVALAVAALLDIRFVFPYPNLWPPYYLMWDFAVAALYGMVAAAVVDIVPNEWWRAALQSIVAIAAVIIAGRALPRQTAPASLESTSYMQRELRPGETVWLSTNVHPVAAPDASYYWFAVTDLVPASLQYRGASPLPKMSEADLPPCRAERGLQPDLRFVSPARNFPTLPAVRRCLDRLAAAGRAVPTPFPEIWELRH